MQPDNRTGAILGNQRWGHVTSRDEYTFTNQLTALSPLDSDTFPCSERVVAEEANTSDFPPNQANGVVEVLTLQGSSSET